MTFWKLLSCLLAVSHAAPTLPAAQFMLQGYDVMLGNPFLGKWGWKVEEVLNVSSVSPVLAGIGDAVFSIPGNMIVNSLPLSECDPTPVVRLAFTTVDVQNIVSELFRLESKETSFPVENGRYLPPFTAVQPIQAFLAEVATDRLPRLVFYSTCDLYDVRFDSSQSKCPSDAFGSAVHALATGALSPLEFIRGFGTHVVTSVRLGGVRVSVAVVKPHLLAELRRLRLAPVDVASIISLQLSNRTHEGVFVSSLPNPSSLVVSNRTVDLGSLSSLVKWRNADQTKPFLSSSLAVTRVGLQPITEVMSQIATPVPPRFLDFVQSGYCNVLSACSLFYPVWPNAGGDTRASGTSVWSVDVTSRLAVLWLSPESEKVLVTCGPIVVDSSAIAAGTAGGSLIALYRDSGNLLWTLHTGTGCKVVDARYVHNSNQLVVGTACGNLIAFDYWSHTVMWNVTLGASLATTPVHTADGSIWCAVEGSVVNVSPTGGISWSYQLTNDSVSSNIVAFTDGTITAGLTSGGLLSLKSRHARTTPLDSFRPVVHVCVSPLNTVIASDSAGYMFAVSGYSGKLLWRSAGPFTSPPSVFRDVVVVGSPEGLAALFVTNGTVAWQVAWTSQTRVQPTVSVTGHVVVALDDSSVAVVNASTGSFVWKSTLDNSLNLTSPVVIHADGTLYGVSSNQTLVSFAV